MATIIFEQVFVSQSIDGDGNKLDIYRYWQNDYGSLGRFRATETIGYGEKITYQSYNFLAEGKVADKLKKMKLKAGSTLYVVGELVPEIFEGKAGKLNRIVVKVLDARFTSGSQKKEQKEKTPEEQNIVPKKVSIPVPKEVSERQEPKEVPKEIPKPFMGGNESSYDESEEEVIDLDIQSLFSEANGFVGIKNPSA